MPSSITEHITYTRNELEMYPYYVEVLKILKENAIVSYVDIGANIGEFCNVLVEKIPTLKTVYLIEPEKYNFEFLKSHVVAKDASFFNFAIGYGLTNFALDSGDGNVGGYKLVPSQHNESVDVQIKTLEEINLPVVDFVKIDIEGGEYNVIENSKYLQQIKYIEIEFHNYHATPTRGYVASKFPNHEIVCIEALEGRCLLKKIK